MRRLIERSTDLRKGFAAELEYVPSMMVMSNDDGHEWRVSVYDDGEPVDLAGGTVRAYILRADNYDFYVDGSVEGNVAKCVFPAAAYGCSGRIRCLMDYTKSGDTFTLDAFYSDVIADNDGTPIDPGSVVPSYQSLLTQIQNMRDATSDAQDAADAATAAANTALVFASDPSTVIPAGSDLNDYHDPGSYTATAAVNAEGFLDNSPYYGIPARILNVYVTQVSNKRMIQFFIANTSVFRIYARPCYTANYTFGAWHDITGSVSYDVEQLSSLDTGAALDDLLSAGSWKIAASKAASIENAPGGQYAAYAVRIINAEIYTGRIMQTSYQMLDNGDVLIYVRLHYSDGWTDWSKLTTQTDLDAVQSDVDALTADKLGMSSDNSVVLRLTDQPDIDALTTPGSWLAPSDVNNSEGFNSPDRGNRPARVVTLATNTSTGRMQFFLNIYSNKPQIFARAGSGGTWYAWYKTDMTAV